MRSGERARWLATVLMAAGAAGGCAKPQVTMPGAVTIEGFDEATRKIQSDPVAFLHGCLAQTRELDAFTCHFQRQERLGLFKELRPQEDMRAEFRREPFSVRLTWNDEHSKYRQCVYVNGTNDDKVILMPRKGLFGLPPGEQRWPVDFAVKFQEARNPLSDFGPQRMMERILDRIEKAEAVGEVSIKLQGAAEIGPAKEPCFHLVIRYPRKDPFPNKLQDLYIHTQTRWPVATYLWLPGKVERCDETLDAMYVYSGINPDVKLTDANFVLDPPEKRRAMQARGQGGDRPTSAQAGVAPVQAVDADIEY